MRWLWQHAARWASSQVVNEAKRAAAAQATPDNETEPGVAAGDTKMAVVCETKRLFDAVADSLGSPRHVEGDRFALCAGKLAGKRVVVTRPLVESANPKQLITAIVDGHHPQFVLSAAEATSLSAKIPPGGVVVASRVTGSGDQSLRLDGTAPAATGFFTGSVATRGAATTAVVDPADAPLAEDEWSEAVARACQQAGVAMMAASLVLQPVSEQRSQAAESLKKQSSLAGRAGVLTGMLWKKRSGLRDVWNEKEAAWEACGRLAQLANYLVSSAGD